MPLQMVNSVTQALAHEVLPAVPNVDNIRRDGAELRGLKLDALRLGRVFGCWRSGVVVASACGGRAGRVGRGGGVEAPLKTRKPSKTPKPYRSQILSTQDRV